MSELTDLEKFEKAKPLIDEALTLVSVAQMRFYIGELEHAQGKAAHEKIMAEVEAAKKAKGDK